MDTHTISVGSLVQTFFTEHLLLHKCASPQTIASYRDTFRLLLQFVHTRRGVAPDALKIDTLGVSTILEFLHSLEQERHNCVRSRNARLAAIRSFFRWVALKEPVCIGLVTQILAIPVKRAERRLVTALSRAEVDALLATPDLTTWQGRRDHALLLTLYNSGARVSEITALQREHIHFGASSFLNLTGKGRKERNVPLWPKSARVLKAWFRELGTAIIVFPNARGQMLSRNGVDHILQRAVGRAIPNCPSLCNKHISPHTWRHTTAMHLLQSGVDISVIALWLGHESTETTHIYIEADLATKERALQKLAPAGEDVPQFKASDQVLAFLASL